MKFCRNVPTILMLTHTKNKINPIHGFGDIIKIVEGGDVAANATRMFQQHVVATLEVILSQTTNWIELKFCRQVPMVLDLMHDKNQANPMHISRYINKMVESENVYFLKNPVPYCTEI